MGSLVGHGVKEAHRLHGSKAQGIFAPLGHDLDGQAAVEVVQIFEFVGGDSIGGAQGVVEDFVLFAIHGAV